MPNPVTAGTYNTESPFELARRPYYLIVGPVAGMIPVGNG